MHLSRLSLLLTVFGLTLTASAETQITINVGETKSFPTLASVARAFHETQKPEVMFLGVTRRFKDASLDTIAEDSLPFFETRPANLSGIIYQVLAISNLSHRLLKGEAVSPAHRDLLRQELATIAATRKLFQEFMSNVPANSKILVPRDGKLCDIRGEINLIERECVAAANALGLEADKTARLASL